MNISLVMQAKRACQKAGLKPTNKQLRALGDKDLEFLIRKAKQIAKGAER